MGYYSNFRHFTPEELVEMMLNQPEPKWILWFMSGKYEFNNKTGDKVSFVDYYNDFYDGFSENLN